MFSNALSALGLKTAILLLSAMLLSACARDIGKTGESGLLPGLWESRFEVVDFQPVNSGATGDEWLQELARAMRGQRHRDRQCLSAADLENPIPKLIVGNIENCAYRASPPEAGKLTGRMTCPVRPPDNVVVADIRGDYTLTKVAITADYHFGGIAKLTLRAQHRRVGRCR